VPPIPEYYLNCSIFLYPSEQTARDGDQFGGSGFVIHFPVEGHDNWGSLYAVTNKHVLDAGCRFIRFNTKTAGVHVIESERDKWIDHPDRYDVSVLSLDVDGETLEYSSIGIEKFITREIVDDYSICPGDEAFLVGRLITPWGQQRNKPAVRFGNISMMADANEPARGWGDVEQEVFFVECRSLSGFSGSPVFVSTTRYYDKAHAPKAMRDPKPDLKGVPADQRLKIDFLGAEGTFGPWLLGIDWGHLPLWKPVYDRQNLQSLKANHWVEQNTGIACVLPAWHILHLLNDEGLAQERKAAKAKLDEQRQHIDISPGKVGDN
jgi:hypothetical protein